MPRRPLRRSASPIDPFTGNARRPDRATADDALARLPRVRRGLPDGRAVIGGLLVAAAVVGTWWLGTGTGRPAQQRYVVATHLIDPGRRLRADDVQLAPMDLAPTVRPGAFTDPGALVGMLALGPIGKGSLVQAAGVAPAPSVSGGRELSFAVETAWAVDGSLRAGDRIDVFATAADGTEGRTTTVLRGAVVRHVSATGGGLGETTGLTLSVAVRADADLDQAVTAMRSSKLTVVRSTGITAAEAGTTPARRSSEPRSGQAPRSSASTTTTTSARRTTTTRAPGTSTSTTVPASVGGR